MKATVPSGTLALMAQVVSKAVATNTTIPYLAGIRIEAGDGTIEMQATNLDVSIRHEAAALVDEPGVAVVSGRVLQGIVKSLPDAPVNLDGGDGGVLRIGCKRSKYSLNTLSAKDYPAFPDVEPESQVTLPSALLADMVGRVYKVASKDNSRPILTGISASVEGGRLRLVATDSYRLTVCESDAQDVAEFSTVIPSSALHDAMGMPTMTEAVTIGTSENQVVMSFGGTTYVARRIEGTFPNWKALVPKSHATQVTLDTADMLATLRRVSVVAQSNPTVRLDVDPEAGAIRMSASAPDQGDASEDIDCDVSGEPLSIGLNHRYLSDSLDGANGSGSLVVEFIDGAKPALFRSYGSVDYLSLLMPVRI